MYSWENLFVIVLNTIPKEILDAIRIDCSTATCTHTHHTHYTHTHTHTPHRNTHTPHTHTHTHHIYTHTHTTTNWLKYKYYFLGALTTLLITSSLVWWTKHVGATLNVVMVDTRLTNTRCKKLK